MSRLGPLAIGAALLATSEPVPLFALLRALTVLSLLPGAAAWLIGRAFSADLEVRGQDFVIHGHDRRIEVPCTSVERLRAWTVPLPGAGFSLGMRSGRRFAYGIETAEPQRLLAALAAAGVTAAERTAGHPNFIYADAKRSWRRRRWYRLVGKYVGFGLLPAAVMFNLHQHVAYGGLLGQYYLEGLSQYVRTFAVYWGLATIYLLLYASAWRALAEAVAYITAWAVPPRALSARRVAELFCNLAYYGGVPLLLLVPFLQ